MSEPLRLVGRYELLEVIGRGGAAVVYLARQPDLDRKVALKELSPHHAGDPSFAQRFVQESRVAGSMSHPSIVTVHEFFEHDDIPYIAMEYMPRGSLRSYLPELTLPQLAGTLESVLAGLTHGERQGVIHRDLKPENLLVAGDGHVKIGDFGVARALGHANPRPFSTITGTTIGTPAYMAPEQALGEPLSPATDLYSLGIIAWEVLAGRVPFESRDTPMAVLYHQVNDPVPAIDTVRPEVGPGLASWLAKLLAKRPEDRFQSGEAAWDELEDVVIDLAGPRWRRKARITGENLETPGTYTPGSRQSTPVSATITDPPDTSREPEPAPAEPPTALPALSGSRGDTVIRTSRRHAGNSTPAVEPVSHGRNRRPLMVAAAVVVIGALIGAGVGVLTAQHSTTKRVTTTPAAHLAAFVSPLMRTLEEAQRPELARMRAATGNRAQAGAAVAVSRAYVTAARHMRALPAVQARLPAAQALRSGLARVGAGWSSVAAAARRGDRGGYRTAVAALHQRQRQLDRAVLVAERG
jgi:serine/threonine protein kinase